jgi:hypothetical protein
MALDRRLFCTCHEKGRAQTHRIAESIELHSALRDIFSLPIQIFP